MVLNLLLKVDRKVYLCLFLVIDTKGYLYTYIDSISLGDNNYLQQKGDRIVIGTEKTRRARRRRKKRKEYTSI